MPLLEKENFSIPIKYRNVREEAHYPGEVSIWTITKQAKDVTS